MKKLTEKFIFLLFLFPAIVLWSEPIYINRSTPSLISLDFHLEEYNISHKNNYSFIETPGLYFSEIPGDARMPSYSFLVGVPPDGSIKYQILNQKTKRTYLQYPVAPCPEFVKTDFDETHTKIYKIKPELYKKSLFSELITLSEPFIWRKQKVVEVTIHPFQSTGAELIITSNINLKFNILGNTSFRNQFTDKSFEMILENSIINFNNAKFWQIRAKRPVPENPFDYADRWFKIPISEDGIYKITKSRLAELEIDVENLHRESIKIFNDGGYALARSVPSPQPELQEIPVFSSEVPGDFSVYFYARNTNGFEMNEEYEQYFNPFTPYNIYWLTYNYKFSGKTF